MLTFLWVFIAALIMKPCQALRCHATLLWLIRGRKRHHGSGISHRNCLGSWPRVWRSYVRLDAGMGARLKTRTARCPLRIRPNVVAMVSYCPFRSCIGGTAASDEWQADQRSAVRASVAPAGSAQKVAASKIIDRK